MRSILSTRIARVVAISMLLLLAISTSIAAAATPAGRAAPAQSVPLDGHRLTIAQVVAVARDDARVGIPAPVMERVDRSYQLLFEAARQDKPIYGLTRGVGENKDKTIFKGGTIDAEARRLSEEFNANLLRVQSSAVGPPASREVIRAAMLIRLNTMLIGHTGVQKQVVVALRGFLNKGITPIVPSRGTVGEADIDIMAHVGLALMGEGRVWYRGRSMPAARAIEQAGLRPIVPFGKDALSIFSSNAYSAALAVLAADDAAHMLDRARQVFGLSLEGLNGNVAPFLPAVQAVRAFPGQRTAARQILGELRGSYLWSPSPTRALQDPLSYRSFSQVLGTAEHSLDDLERELRVQINSSDDNPTVVLGAVPSAGATPQERSYYVNGNGHVGAVFPTANFTPVAWVLRVESLSNGLAHVSSTAVQRTFRLGSPEFTHLSRFLSADALSIAYAAIQKIPADLDARNRELANPVSTTVVPVAGDIEDTATNAAAAAENLGEIVDNSYYICAVELMHAAQAVNLRQRDDPGLALGRSTRPFLGAYRATVPFLDKDRVLSTDILKSYRFLRGD